MRPRRSGTAANTGIPGFCTVNTERAFDQVGSHASVFASVSEAIQGSGTRQNGSPPWIASLRSQ